MRQRLFLLVIATFIALPAFADWEQAFREGVRAYERKRYAETVSFMKAAIDQKAVADGANVPINGGFNANYTPYHYLAAAYAQLGNCDEAVAAMRRGQSGAKNDGLTRVVESKCGKLQLGPTPAELEAQKKADDAKKAEAARLEEDRRKAEAARIAEDNKKKEDAKKAAEESKKAEDIRIAEENRKKSEDAKKAEDVRIAEENRKKEEANAATKLAEETEKARKDAEAKKAEELRLAEEKRKADEAKKLADSLVDAKKSLNGVIARSRSLLQSATDSGPARQNLENAVSSASSMKATTAEELLTTANGVSRLYTEYLNVVTSGSSEKSATINFKAAIEAYISGHYDQAITLLAKANYTGVLKAQAALFKAASKFANSQIKGDSSVGTVAGIITDVSEFRRLQPNGTLDERVFSPAFRDFVAQNAR